MWAAALRPVCSHPGFVPGCPWLWPRESPGAHGGMWQAGRIPASAVPAAQSALAPPVSVTRGVLAIIGFHCSPASRYRWWLRIPGEQGLWGQSSPVPHLPPTPSCTLSFPSHTPFPRVERGRSTLLTHLFTGAVVSQSCRRGGLLCQVLGSQYWSP